jgi:hypothetical protein
MPMRREVKTRLTRRGNGSGLSLTEEALAATALDRDDRAVITASEDGLTVRKAYDEHRRWMAAYREIADRYRHTFAALAE